MRRMKKILSAFMALITIAGLSGCVDEFMAGELNDVANALENTAKSEINSLKTGNASEWYHKALVSGNIEWIDEIIERYPEYDINYDSVGSALYTAIWDSIYNKEKTVKHILDKGADPNVNHGKIAEIVFYNLQGDCAELLIDTGNLDYSYETTHFKENFYSLSLDPSGSDVRVQYQQIKALLDAGAEPKTTIYYNPDLSEGSEYSTLDRDVPICVKMITERFVEMGGTGFGEAFDLALSGRPAEAIAELKKTGCSEYDEKQLSLISQYIALFGTPEQYEEATELLNGTKFYFKNHFIDIIQTGNLEMIKYFVENNTDYYYDKAKFDADDVEKHLVEAAKWGQKEICEYIINTWDIEYTFWTPSGYIPLYHAFSSKDLDTIKFLFDYFDNKYGIDENAFARAVGTLIGTLDDGYTKEIIDYFFEKGYDFSDVTVYDSPEVLAYLYEKGRPLVPNDLTFAVLSGDTEYVRLVLDKGADPNQRAYDEIYAYRSWKEGGFNNYENYIAAEENQKKNGIYISKMLYFAIAFSNSKVTQLLIDYGADVLESDYMMYAINGSAATAKVLIENGADTSLKYTPTREGITINAFKKENLTLAEYYEYYGRQDLVELLKEYK